MRSERKDSGAEEFRLFSRPDAHLHHDRPIQNLLAQNGK